MGGCGQGGSCLTMNRVVVGSEGQGEGCLTKVCRYKWADDGSKDSRSKEGKTNPCENLAGLDCVGLFCTEVDCFGGEEGHFLFPTISQYCWWQFCWLRYDWFSANIKLSCRVCTWVRIEEESTSSWCMVLGVSVGRILALVALKF